MVIHRRIYRQGNSRVISLPAWLLGGMNCDVGDKVQLESTAGGVVTMTKAEEVQTEEKEQQGKPDLA